MKIHDCLLDIKNRVVVEYSTLGGIIVGSNKDHLWEERVNEQIDTVVIHCMSAVAIKLERPYDLNLLLKILCDYGVSSHYLISRKGKILRLVPEDKKAWHCGGSIMPEPDNRTGVNEFSIGIELAATNRSGFTDSQYDALCNLCIDIEKRHGKKMRYVGHDQIAGKRAVDLGLRKDRKVDPGPLFNWEFFMEKMARLAGNGH
ncbi:MAG: N-acetylmuramoyl-L-alanine amidase [Chitinispirillales bacterium]|jgi:N-acetyl-anhydromuramyl-L-alanine amidase AmpD|nr:N-acetylmuramoyl-L-alanine amidase [Chitinispirillales bacterium]